jgi:sulfonate transport system ATP-binding protein
MASSFEHSMRATGDAVLGQPLPASQTAHGPTAVHVRGLRKRFGDNVVLDGVGLDVARGEFVALLGASGTGKTTLLRILAGLELPDDNEGVILVPKVRTTVYQEPRLVPSMRVLTNVTIGQTRGLQERAAAKRALSEVGLARLANAWPATLSGGEAQRVALARALVREPGLLLLDEPFAALDALTKLQMQDLVADLCAVHRPAVLLVTHDVDEAIRLADRVLVLRDGHFVVNLPIDIPRPRGRNEGRNDQQLLEHRSALLGELGVKTHRTFGQSDRERPPAV